MPAIRKPLKEADIKQATVLSMRKLYLELAQDMNQILEEKVMVCPKCGNWLSSSGFWEDDRYHTGHFPVCKDCLTAMASNSDGKRKGKESRDSVKKTLRFMDRPFKEELWANAVSTVKESNPKKNYVPAFATYLKMLELSPYRQLTYDDGDVTDEDRLGTKSVVSDEIKNRWGSGFSDEDYLFLQKEYDDWTSRYECSTKAHEELFMALACNKLEKLKARRDNRPTKDIDATFNTLLNTANITPKQNKTDAFMEAQTLGTLIQKWEETEPLPELDPKLTDVEHIALTQDLLLAHACKTAGVKTGYSENYEKFLEEYTVLRNEYQEDNGDADLFNSLFSQDEGIK